MIRFIVHAALCLVLLSDVSTALAQGHTWEDLTEEDAVRVVREFESDPLLEVTPDELEVAEIVDPSMFAQSAEFRLHANGFEYTISRYTRHRFSRHSETFGLDNDAFYGQPYDPYALAGQAMPPENAEAIAIAFMQAHFPDPQILTRRTVTPRGIGEMLDPDPHFTSYYAVDFQQDCGGGVSGPSFCHVEVDSVFGRVIGFIQAYYPVLVSTVPELTGEQATIAAMNAMLSQPGTPETVESLSVTHPDALGIERLAYHLSFTGLGPAYPTEETYVCTVDAQTGGVLNWDIVMGTRRRPGASGAGGFRFGHRLRRAPPLASAAVEIGGRVTLLAYPPLLLEGRPYLYVGYLAYGLPGARARYCGRRDIRVSGAGRDLRFSVESATCRINGSKVTLSAKPVILSGRCYVPLEAARGVLPLRVSYDARARRVRLDPPRKAAR